MNPKRLYLVSLIFKVIPLSRCHNFKSKLLRWCGVYVGKNVEIFSSAKFIGNGEVKIGDNVFIGAEAMISCNKGSCITIENYALISIRTILTTGFHPITPDGPRIVSYEGTCSNIHIGQGALCSPYSIILPGITVGKMAHVAAGSVVTKDVEPYMRVAGNPARPIRNLLTNEKISR